MREGRDTVRHNGRTTILLLIGVAVVVAAIAAPSCAFASGRLSRCRTQAGVTECRDRPVVGQPASAPIDSAVPSRSGAAPEAVADLAPGIGAPGAWLSSGFQVPLRI